MSDLAVLAAERAVLGEAVAEPSTGHRLRDAEKASRRGAGHDAVDCHDSARS